jgi:tetratricopeptide (TPR) repeat protein
VQKQTLLEGLRALPGDERLLRSLGSLLEEEGNWQELQEIMLDQLPRLQRGSPMEAHLCYLASKACLELGDLRQALALGTRAVQGRPDFAYCHHIYGRTLARMGRRVEALGAQQRCAALAPGFPWCWFEIGQLQLAQGDMAAAKAALQRALALQEAQNPAGAEMFRRTLEGVQEEASLAERRAAAASLWPERAPLGPDERLDPIDELAVVVEEFRLFLELLEGRGTLG